MSIMSSRLSEQIRKRKMTTENKIIERKILSIITCGRHFGGNDNNSWICGDFLEEGIDLGRCYYCENCYKKAEEIIKLFAGKSLC